MKSLRVILKVFRRRGYHVHTRPYQLNMVGIRSAQTRAGAFDDRFAVFYRDDRGKWHYHEYPCTTDPGTYYLENPIWQDTAILKQGQYLNTYAIGTHAGKYTALVQQHEEVTVIRDYNRDAILDFQNGETRTGKYGINIHRASPGRESMVIHRWSAGCQVLSRPGDFEHLMSLARRHRDTLGHNYFSYTLIDFRAVRRAKRARNLTRAGVALAVAGVGLVAWKAFKPQAA